MKKLLLCLVTFSSISTFASKPESKLICAASGTVDSIKKIEIVNTDLTGQINASTEALINNRSVNTQFCSNGSLDDDKIILSEVDTGPFGINATYLEKVGNDYAIVKYNTCSFYYQEETCSSNPTPVETQRDSKLVCIKI